MPGAPRTRSGVTALPLHAWSSARYVIPLPDGHRFPDAKYALLREQVLARGLVAPERLHEPARASREAVELAHTADYVDRLSSGDLDEQEQRLIGFPWSEALVERSFRAVGGTCEAAAAALDHGLTINLAGRTHHAFPDHGEGFCVFNDTAIAIRSLQREGRVVRAAIVDLNDTVAVHVGTVEVAAQVVN